MKIVVIGCGKIGTAVISSLVSEGHDVVAVDENPSAIDDIRDVYDVICICGNGADYDTLLEAGIDKTDAFVAITGSDELNMLSCVIAKKMGAKHTVARIRNPEYNDKNLPFVKQYLDLSLHINPELLVASELFNILKLPSAVNIETFSRRNFELVEFILKENSVLDGMSLIDLRKKYKSSFLIGLVMRDNEVYVPDGNFILKKGDRIGIIATPHEIHRFFKTMGVMQKQAKNIMILGASTTAFYLTKMLLSAGSAVTIIDKDKERCELAAQRLPGAVIINGDGASQEVLLEEGLLTSDALVTLTGMDEENILVSFFAMSQQVPKVIAKINSNELISMAEKLGIDSVISPRRIVSDVVTRYARALHNSVGSNVETLYKFMDGRIEALEFNVSSDFKALQVPLKEMKLKPNVLIGGIIRKRKAFIPTGDDVICAGDRVVVISEGQKMNDLSDILK